MAKTKSSLISMGLWDAEASKKLLQTGNSDVNWQPIEYTKNQLVQLYLMLYPFISADFSHRQDLYMWAKKQLDQHNEKTKSFNSQIDKLTKEINSHKHLGNLGSPTSPPTVPSSSPQAKTWETNPEDQEFKYGESLITESSEYSTNIKHRQPRLDGQNIQRKQSEEIGSSYRKVQFRTPFDIGGKDIEEGNEYAHK